ncbi:unnamed protein product [Aspergillus oryzae]|nr:unnamed protein product [Aspergillus oryzae]
MVQTQALPEKPGLQYTPEDKSCPLVSQVEVWAKDHDRIWGHISGLRITYPNGKASRVLGSTTHDYHCLKLEKGERITSWVVNWAKPNKEYRLIHIKTKKPNAPDGNPRGGQDFRVGVASNHKGEWVGYSGLLRGVNVTVWKDPTKSDDDRWAVVHPIFITDISRVTRKLVIREMPDQSSINPVGFDSSQIDNRGSDTEEIRTISRTKSTTNTTTFTDSWTENVEVQSETEFDILELVHETITVKFGASHQSTKSHEYTEEITLTWQDTITIPPGKYYTVDLSYYEAKVIAKYDDHIIIFLQNGDKIEWNEGPTEAEVNTANLSTIVVCEIGEDGQKHRPNPIPGDPKDRGN